MNPAERLAVRVRRSLPLAAEHPFWRMVRPMYRRALGAFGHRGLARCINGIDEIRLVPELYTVGEAYEPDVWRTLMATVRPGDTVVDVGAAIGLYALALGNRVGPSGRVVAFEPDPHTADLLLRNVALNGLTQRVTVRQLALGETPGTAPFRAGAGLESHIANPADTVNVLEVPVTTLDEAFPNTRVDILKLDVEGFEERVLRGGRKLLMDTLRAPRAMFIEVHPYAWPALGATSASLQDLLSTCGYDLVTLDGQPVGEISVYGEIVARRRATFVDDTRLTVGSSNMRADDRGRTT